MVQFVFTNLLMVSLGVMLYLAARTLPRLQEEETNGRKHSLLERWVMSEIPHQLDQLLATATGKFFRKVKVYLLRVDNYLTKKLKRINTEVGLTGQKKAGIDVMEIRTTDYVGPDRREDDRRRNLPEPPAGA